MLRTGCLVLGSGLMLSALTRTIMSRKLTKSPGWPGSMLMHGGSLSGWENTRTRVDWQCNYYKTMPRLSLALSGMSLGTQSGFTQQIIFYVYRTVKPVLGAGELWTIYQTAHTSKDVGSSRSSPWETQYVYFAAKTQCRGLPWRISP